MMNFETISRILYNFVFKTRNRVFKTRNFALNVMNFAGLSKTSQWMAPVRIFNGAVDTVCFVYMQAIDRSVSDCIYMLAIDGSSLFV